METKFEREFGPALQRFFEGCQRIANEHTAANYSNNEKPPFKLEELKVRWRIRREGSAHAFVCKNTGDVLMPASWSKPAKHARGNIFDDQNGLGQMGPYGPKYLR
ncbi:hypothetical protein [Bradyrhizobium sp. SZCCHNS3053]|uniref:DUF7717 family protein n=1 Tax=Bradyrhizobium sp. SZCCHNS3053 TaxID=3057322 RepID=UPI002916C3B2|nr:hypothetical protein [Bradyrhizobium sp. SZCCHNS3053]